MMPICPRDDRKYFKMVLCRDYFDTDDNEHHDTTCWSGRKALRFTALRFLAHHLNRHNTVINT